MEIYSENRKAHYDYEILDKYEAGLVLNGQEVKSIKTGHMNLSGSYVVFRKGPASNASRSDAGWEPFLIGSKVPAWQPKNAPPDYNTERSRKLLLNKKEIQYLFGKSQERGFSLIPLKVYGKSGRIKLEFGLARGRKKHDKKEKIKRRDIDREIRGNLKS